MEGFEKNHGDLAELQKRFDSYCRRVLKNAEYNMADSATRKLRHEQLTLEDVPEGFYETDEVGNLDAVRISAGNTPITIRDRELAEALMRLQKRKREILILSDALEYTLPEISDELKISYETAKSTKSKAVIELRKGGKHEKKKRL